MSQFRIIICRTIIATRPCIEGAFPRCSYQNSLFSKPVSTFSTEKKNQPETDEDELNKPIKFSTSPAAKWKAKTSRTGDSNPRLWYEPYVVTASLAIFLGYFLLLREESDIDEEFSKSLYSRIQGLEEQQLRLALEYNKERGFSAGDIESRIKEIKEEEKAKVTI